ncbi:MAG: site-specific DNA-methyltransferase, partial [Deltaproteobacteria bacterium]|nr:site-specific DNA-methyltransferase [Deltaproteobacteria bacterium]
PAPTGAKKKRNILEKFISQYTGRNTKDYFIHKNLKGFLSRELDFHIKNEIMNFSDIEDKGSKSIGIYLQNIKTFRKIALKLIDFLVQLEEFQKQLWLKKKFVTETNYCITLDRIPEKLYPRIASNPEQCDEWIKLFAINKIKSKDSSISFSRPLSFEFLKLHDKLVLDTRFFDESFKAKLVQSIHDFDNQCDGLLINSENFQALNFLQYRYKKKIRCIHIDPPYNTASSGFLYKNSYEHSSWLTMMDDRIELASLLLDNNGDFICHIDENEYEYLNIVFNNHDLNPAGTIIWNKKNPMLGRKGIATQHEYIIWRTKSDRPILVRSQALLKMREHVRYLIEENSGVTDKVRKKYIKWINGQNDLTGGEKAYKFIDDDGEIYRLVAMGAPEKRIDPKFHIPLIHPLTGKICPVPPNGWSRTPDTIAELQRNNMIVFGVDEKTQPQKKVYLSEHGLKQITSIYSDGKSGKSYLDPLGLEFPYCHPVSMYEYLMSVANENSIFMDFFAGSGTTGHAVLNLTRSSTFKHKYILVEMGEHFDSVLIPRLKKVVYSKDWKDGVPLSYNTGISHCFKYIRLESYEDTLNNLSFAQNAEKKPLIANNPKSKEDFNLQYMLDVETNGRTSLLNVDAFSEPFRYAFNFKKSGSSQSAMHSIDLIETFNYLIGLNVVRSFAPKKFHATFLRKNASDRQDQKMKLVLKNDIQKDKKGKWWFKKIEGWQPFDIVNQDNSQKQNVLIIWRNLTNNIEEDNLVLDNWFLMNRKANSHICYDIIYVNGSNNLHTLVRDKQSPKICLIEEEFMKRMWS